MYKSNFLHERNEPHDFIPRDVPYRMSSIPTSAAYIPSHPFLQSVVLVQRETVPRKSWLVLQTTQLIDFLIDLAVQLESKVQ